jgi:hypothetical protein
VDTAPKIVLQNPYRILGVYANSKRQEILANKSKATAFLKVNKSVEYPLDLKGILPAPNRTLDLMNEAEAHLAIAKEQIKYAQFWFLQKMSPLDDIAFNHLLAGNMTGATEIWAKQESLSSLQNRLVCYLIESKIELALKTAEKLYENFGNDYISKVDANCTLKMTAADLLHQFIESISEEIGMQKLLGFDLRADTKTYISSQTIGPLINKISSEVDKTKKVDHKDPKARIEAARKLVANTKETFSQLKSILPATDSQYQMIADKLGLEILQCGIDYFNNSKDEVRHKTAMKMQKYAQSIVVGTLAKQRCEENVRILQDMIDRLPPEETKKEHENLQKIIALFILLPIDVDAVLKFLKDTCPDLISIKEKLGKNNTFYIQQATLIAQIALSKSIDALNEAQEEEFPKLNGTNRDDAIKTMKHVFAASWEIMLWIELIDADSDFKANRLKPNKTALKNILDQVDALKEVFVITRFLGGSYSVFEGCASQVSVDKYIYYTEDEMYSACKTIEACKQYIDKYRRGKYSKEVHQILSDLEDDRKYANARMLHEIEDYLKVYPNGRHVIEAKAKRTRILEEQRKKWEQEVNEQLRQVDYCKSIQNCIAIMPQCMKLKSDKLNAKLDDKFFSLCSSANDYERYIAKMGNSARHAEEAREKIRTHNMIVWGLVAAVIIFIIILATL